MKFVKAISKCHNVYLTESKDDGKALQLGRSPRVLRSGREFRFSSCLPLKRKTRHYRVGEDTK